MGCCRCYFNTYCCCFLLLVQILQFLTRQPQRTIYLVNTLSLLSSFMLLQHFNGCVMVSVWAKQVFFCLDKPPLKSSQAWLLGYRTTLGSHRKKKTVLLGSVLYLSLAVFNIIFSITPCCITFSSYLYYSMSQKFNRNCYNHTGQRHLVIRQMRILSERRQKPFDWKRTYVVNLISNSFTWLNLALLFLVTENTVFKRNRLANFAFSVKHKYRPKSINRHPKKYSKIKIYEI